MDKEFEKLAAIVSTMQLKINQINLVILTFEDRLKALSPGVPCWLAQCFSQEKGAKRVRRAGIHYLKTEGWDLGYTKYGEGWRIVGKKVAHYFHADRFDPEGKPVFSHSVDAGDPIPLIKCPRYVRAKSMGSLGELLQKIETIARSYVETIDQVCDSMGVPMTDSGASSLGSARPG